MYRNSVRFSLYWMALSVLVNVLLIRRSLHDEMIPQRHLVPSLSSVDLSWIVPTEDDESFVDTTKNDSKMEVAPTALQSSSLSSLDFHHLSTRTTNQSSTFTAQQRIMAAAHFSLAQSRQQQQQQQQQQHLIPTPRNSSQSVFFTTIYNFNNRTWVFSKQCESRCYSTVDPRTGRFPTRGDPSGPYL